LQYDIYGYSGIKPRAIQDYYDVLGSPANPTFWRMLNVKYIVFDKNVNYPGLQLIYSGEKTFLYLNQNTLPRAFFVNRVETKSALQILNLVKNNQFDPLDVAFIEKDLEGIKSPDSTAYVKIVGYKDERVTFDINASGKNFLFFGDTYFPVGWKAFVNGNETEIFRTNHGFRGIVVPEGNHKVEFIYSPESFVISKYVALSISSLVLLGLIAAVFIECRKKKNTLLF
jgi:uncharacterized membrane protein YfhO